MFYFYEIEVITLKDPVGLPIFLVRGLDRRSVMWCHGIVTALTAWTTQPPVRLSSTRSF